jgi:energy-coupling factor transporter ATP-binding protein EcfA2
MYDSFGFKANPFNVMPLRPTTADANLFVARRTEVNSFQVDISSVDRALVLVTGHRGVGKTSFVSIMQYMASPLCQLTFTNAQVHVRNLVPCYHKVQIDPDENVSNLLFKCVSSLLFSIREFQNLRSAMFPVDLESLMNWVSNVVPESAASGGISIAGFGGTFGSSTQYRSIKDIPPMALCEQIKKIVAAVKPIGCRGIFLNLDNLEIVDEAEMAALMDQLRDYLFEIDGLWVTLIGYPGMYSVLTARASRVSEFVSGQETYLDALAEDDFIQVLRVRKRALANNSNTPDPALPLDEMFIRSIYRNTDGEIRAVLKACDDVVRAVFKANPTVRLIPEEVGKPFLKGIMRQQLGLAFLKSKERQILNQIVRVETIRPKDYASLSLKSAVDFTNRTRPLIEKNLLRKEVEGVAAKYEVSGSVRLGIYAGLNLLED